MNHLSIDRAEPPPRDTQLAVRAARPDDGASLWRFVEGDATLETNSPYAYLLLCDHFRDTTRVAVDGDSLAGFVAAYRPPRQPDTVFVWQVGVGASWRGRGLGGALLVDLATSCGPAVRFLEATVTPSNTASERLFRGFGRRMNAAVEVGEGYVASLFPDSRAEPERLFRIGPFGGDK